MSFLWGCSYKQRKIAVGWQTQSAALTGSSIVDDGGGVYVLQLDYDKTVPKPSRLYVLEPDGTPVISEYLWASHYMKCTAAPPSGGYYGILALFGTYTSGVTPCLVVDNSLTTLYLGLFDHTTYQVDVSPAGSGTYQSGIPSLGSWRWIASRWKASTRHYEIWVDNLKMIDFVFDAASTPVDMDLWALGVPAYSAGVHFTMRYKDSLMNDEDGNGITGRPPKDDYVWDLLVPNGDYTNTGWRDEGAGSANIYQSVDEIPVSGADYVVNDAPGAPDRYRMDYAAASPGSGKQVRAVVAYTDKAGNEATTCWFEAALGAGAPWRGPDLDGVTGGDPYNYLNTPGQWNMKDFNGTAITTALYNTLNLGVYNSGGGLNYDGFALDVLYGPEVAVEGASLVIPRRSSTLLRM